MEVSRVHEGGNAAMVVSLFALGMIRFHFQIPDQIIIFDPKLKVRRGFIFIFLNAPFAGFVLKTKI